MKRISILFTITAVCFISGLDALAAPPTPGGTVTAIASATPTRTVTVVASSTPTPPSEGRIIIAPPIKPKKPLRPLPKPGTPRPVITVAATATPTLVPTPGEMVQAAKAGLHAHRQNFGIEDVEQELKVGHVRPVEEDPFYSKAGYYARAKGSVSFRQKLPDPGTGAELEVADTEMRVWVNRLDQVTNIKGTFFSDLAVVAEETRITKDQAERIAADQFHFLFPRLTPRILSSSLKIFAPRVYMTWERNPDPMGYKAWVVHLISEPRPDGDIGADLPANEIFYISAFDGHLLWHTTNVRGINRKILDCSTGMCWYGQRRWYNGQYYYFGRVEGQNPVGPNPVYGGTDTDDVYQWFADADSYVLANFGRNGANGLGGTGDGSQVPYGTDQATVYIDPLGILNCPFGGKNVGYELWFCSDAVQIDIFGHEYAHGFSHFAHWLNGHPVGMLYEGEPGALDENQADFFGKMFEKYKTGDHTWIFPSAPFPGPGWRRNLKEPWLITNPLVNKPYPGRFTVSDLYCGSLDNGGVHHNSTVLSRAIALLVEGGTEEYGPGIRCIINPIALGDIEQIWYRAVTQYYSRTETFNQAYLSLRFACDDLFPPPPGEHLHTNCVELAKALDAVGLRDRGRCKSDSPIAPMCLESEIEPTCSFGGCQ